MREKVARPTMQELEETIAIALGIPVKNRSPRSMRPIKHAATLVMELLDEITDDSAVGP